MLILSLSCFAACGYHLSPRIAIVFSLLSSVSNSSKSNSSASLISSSSTSRVLVHFTFSYYVGSTLDCVATRAYLCIYSLLLPAILVYLFFLAGSGALHETAVSAFSQSPSGRATTPSSIPFASSPVYLLSVFFPDFILFLSTSISLISIYYLIPPKLICGHNLFLASSFILPCFLNYATPPCSSSPVGYFLPCRSISYGWQPLFRHVARFLLQLFLLSLLVSSGYIPSSASNDTVLLVVLDHLIFFSAAVICTVSNCFTNSAFSSHTSLGYSLALVLLRGAIVNRTSGTHKNLYI